MDMITLAMAKQYTDQKAGYVEWTDGEITWDGDTTGKFVVPGEELGFSEYYMYVLISNLDVPASNITGFCVVSRGELMPHVLGIERIETYFDGFGHCLFSAGRPDPIAIIFSGDEPMVFVKCSKDMKEYPWKLVGNLTETIHPIDPKFIPGAVLPVVEITTAFEVGANCFSAVLSSDEKKQIKKALSVGDHAIVTYYVGEYPASLICKNFGGIGFIGRTLVKTNSQPLAVVDASVLVGIDEESGNAVASINF